MKSKLADIMKFEFKPVAIIWSDNRPEGALQFGEKRWGCVVSMLAQAAKGKIAAFDRDTYGCMGGAVGLGFGNRYEDYVGGVECFYRFLSSGNDNWEQGRQAAEEAKDKLRAEALEHFIHGERYIKTPELTKKRVDNMPILDVPTKYVIFKPLYLVDLNQETPEVVIYLANAEQLSGLVYLANYARDTDDNVTIPFGAGCHNIGIRAYHEGKSAKPRAVVGLTDPSARKQVVNSLGREYLTFAVPYKMFIELEDNIEGSFLQRHTWQSLTEHKD
jgi:uncharacterized protein (DUF169 family)